MSIASRLLFGFMIGVILMVSVGIFALNQTRRTRDTMVRIVSQDIVIYHEVEQLHSHFLQQAIARFHISLTALKSGADDVSLKRQVEALARQDEQMQAQLYLLQGKVHDFAQNEKIEARRHVYQNISSALVETTRRFNLLRQSSESLLQGSHAAGGAAPGQSRESVEQMQASVVQAMSDILRMLDDGMRAGQDYVNTMYLNGRRSLVFVLAFAVVVALVVTFITRRSIIRPLGTIITVMEGVGHGDLSTKVPAHDLDEFGRLAQVLNRMIDGLREIAYQSREATENLDAAVVEIRNVAQQQAEGAEAQLYSVQETSETMAHITQAGGKITQEARAVIATSEGIEKTASDGLAAVEETARAMDIIHSGGEALAQNIVSLSEKTDAIGEIISTVNGLSERSHILALNAAIEASAAGEHGRSFMVVADEMKILADQSKEATENVSLILGDIQRGIHASVFQAEEVVKRVLAGKERIDTAHATIEKMAASIERATQIFQQIVSSTAQQQAGIEQVMQALRNIRQASQQSVTGIRHLDISASNLGDISHQLLTLATRYRT